MVRAYHTNSFNNVKKFSVSLRSPASFSEWKNNNNYNSREIHIGSYLAGLFEGDGHISISKPGSTPNNLSLSITFHLKDLPLAEKLKEITGFGWIRIKKEDNACVLIFHTIEGLIYTVSLMNSYLRTPKLIKFNELIDTLNSRYSTDIEKYSYQTQNFSKDAWLAGFAEADGSFGIMLTKKETDELGKTRLRLVFPREAPPLGGKTIKKRKVGCRFRIEQRMICPYTNESYEPLLESIATFLNVNLNVVNRASGNKYFNITAKSRESLKIIKNYFNTYTLFSSKYLDYLDWQKVVDFILSQSHYEDKNLDLTEKLKNGMNHNRNNLNWDHLSVLDGQNERVKGLLGFKRHFSSDLDNRNNNKFRGYLAGLYEGDGHIWIQKPGLSKRQNPRFCITFGMKNEPLAKKLLELIGSGFIRYKLQDNACVLVVSPVVGLRKIVNLINGELRTPKIHQLHALIDWLNKNHSTNITKLPLKNSPLSEDGWLSGFIDSDGSFSVLHTKLENGAKKRKIACRLRIEQRILDPVTSESYESVLTNIANFLNCSLLIRNQKSTGNNYYTLTASSKKSLNIIVDYLEKHTLFTSKYLDYKDWKEVVELILDGKHLTEEGISKTDLVRNGMNRQRTYFNWDHLKNLYI